MPCSWQSLITWVQTFLTSLMLLLYTPCVGAFWGIVAVCLKSRLMAESRPNVRWLPLRPWGSPNGKYHAATSALVNFGLPAQRSMGVVP